MHAHSINVYIAARDDDEAIDEYEDEHTERKLHKVAISSRLIAVPPGSLFGIHIKFGNDFDLHGADGVAVLTAWDEFERPLPHCRQLFWIEKADMATETVIENAMSFSKNARSEIWPLQMSRRSDDKNALKATTSWEPEFDTNYGCITVFIRRGMLSNRTGHMSRHQISEPTWEQYQNMELPKVLRQDWFIPLDEKEGEPLIFQFRNMAHYDDDSLCDTEWSSSSPALGEGSRKDSPRRKRSTKQTSGQQTKRSRYSSPLCPTETPSESKMSTKVKAEYLTEDDDEDDEEIPHPVSQQSARIKQEPDLAASIGANTTSAIRYNNTLRTRTPSSLQVYSI